MQPVAWTGQIEISPAKRAEWTALAVPIEARAARQKAEERDIENICSLIKVAAKRCRRSSDIRKANLAAKVLIEQSQLDPDRYIHCLSRCDLSSGQLALYLKVIEVNTISWDLEQALDMIDHVCECEFESELMSADTVDGWLGRCSTCFTGLDYITDMSEPELDC